MLRPKHCKGGEFCLSHNQEYKMILSKDKLTDIYNNEYVHSGTLAELDKKYNTSRGYFSRWFKKLGLVIRDNSINSAKYNFDKNYFEAIDSQEKAYWLGFIFADGFIETKRKYCNRKLGIALAIKDIAHLEKFKKCINGDMPVKIYKTDNGYSNNTEYCKILIASKKMTNDLIKQGVVEKKSNILQPPNISKELIPHFIRGYFDGDGSIWKQTNKNGKDLQYNVSFVGTDAILTYIMDNLLEANAIKRRYALNKRKPTHVVSNIKFGGNNNVLLFLNHLYNDANIFLERKHNIYLDLKELVNSRS
jgi:AraC-like DNA-binding protein